MQSPTAEKIGIVGQICQIHSKSEKLTRRLIHEREVVPIEKIRITDSLSTKVYVDDIWIGCTSKYGDILEVRFNTN
jgi:hypothetical protein